jgi:hypothetical protein
VSSAPHSDEIPAEDLELVEARPPSRDELLEAIPLHCEIDPDVDLDAEDPALVASTGRRRCISSRKAGGRCTVLAASDSLLCAVHSGRLDPAEGGKAKARKAREARGSEEEEARAGRLGTRGVIADTLARRPKAVAGTVDRLLDAASQGDLAAAKLLIPYFNQALGMPTERVEVGEVDAATDMAELTDEQLASLVAERRAALRAVQ